MRQPIPKLEDYNVSPLTGFLPDELPIKRLSNDYYEPWENLVENLPALLLTRRLRGLVDKMPILDAGKLKSEAEWRRACVILGFIAHGYVWGGDKPNDHLPKQVSDPWVEVSDHFELPAIITYAGVCLWNFKTIVPCEPSEWNLDTLATLHTFTGSIDESWFYLVSTAIERQGAPCLTTGLEAIKACREGRSEKVVECLQYLAESIDAINGSLGRMYEMCDPHTFYFRIRPYVAGWKNMDDAGLPNGVRYGDETEYRQVAGGSNAQSSLIQALDILLDIEHHPTGERPSREKDVDNNNNSDDEGIVSAKQKKNNFIHEMRTYMPGPHRRFLEELQKVSDIREYVVTHGKETPALVISYDACLAMLRAFRDKHIQIVSRYIILQAREAQRKAATSKTVREGLASSSSTKNNRGTGGTALIPFLKQARDETGDPAASSWGKRLLSDNHATIRPKRSALKRSAALSSSEDDYHYSNGPHNEPLPAPFRNNKVRRRAAADEPHSGSDSGSQSVGLHGQWEMDDDEKEIAHW